MADVRTLDKNKEVLGRLFLLLLLNRIWLFRHISQRKVLEENSFLKLDQKKLHGLLLDSIWTTFLS